SRYKADHVSSHGGSHHQAIVVQNTSDIMDHIEDDTNVVAIDEVQFFDWTVAELCGKLADDGRRVILAGLDMDFRGEPFGPMPLLMAQAETVDKFQAICLVCGLPASRTQRLIDGRPANYDDPVIMVGANEVYEARCRRHHEVPRS
ncbi:MAG: thymidine kinase, partial [Chloroflexota bacterium]